MVRMSREREGKVITIVQKRTETKRKGMKRNIIDILKKWKGQERNRSKRNIFKYFVETERNEFIKNGTEHNGTNLSDIL